MEVKRSFDLFDTLAGRLHYHPQCIFDVVERTFPFKGFSFYRSMAEAQSNGSLEDIYRCMQSSFGLSAELASDLMQCELESELSQVFPITENVQAVQDGDLILTDTYYSLSQIKQILAKIGLKKRVDIHATVCGKSSGKLWDALKGESILFHLGDNLDADVREPRSKGIEAFHYACSAFSVAEQILLELEQKQMAYLVRALRLQNPFPQHSLEALTWEEQCQLNIPLLLSASIFLADFCKTHQKKRVLFTARDSSLWIQLFQTLFPEYESIYFHTSRFTYNHPSSSFIEYVLDLYTSDSVIVDLCGSGNSAQAFFAEHLKIRPCYLALLNTGEKYHAIARYGKKSERADTGLYEQSMKQGLRMTSLGSDLEKINADLVGALYDVKGKVPLRAAPEYDLKWIEPSHLCVKKCVELLKHFKIQTYDQRVVDWAIRMITGERVLKHVKNVSEHLHFPKHAPKTHLHILWDSSLST